MVKALCATLDGPWWQDRANAHGRNWVWRALRRQDGEALGRVLARYLNAPSARADPTT